MLKSVLVLALALGPVAPLAHELDGERVSAEQIKLSTHLPQTVIIREDRRDPSKVEVVHLKDKIPAGTMPSDLKFEQMALNAETRGIAYDSGNELDMTTSTNSWLFGLALGGGLLLGSALSSGYAYARPSYYPSSSYYGSSYYGSSYSPSYTSAAYYRPYYNYGGYNYSYAPYYRASTPYYNYTYCNWPSYY